MNVLLKSGRVQQNCGGIECESSWERKGVDGERITCPPGDDTGSCPAAQDGIGPSRSIAQEMPALAHGQVINVVDVDGVTRVEIRACAASTQTIEFTHQAIPAERIKDVIVCDIRHIINGMRIGIVE